MEQKHNVFRSLNNLLLLLVKKKLNKYDQYRYEHREVSCPWDAHNISYDGEDEEFLCHLVSMQGTVKY